MYSNERVKGQKVTAATDGSGKLPNQPI